MNTTKPTATKFDDFLENTKGLLGEQAFVLIDADHFIDGTPLGYRWCSSDEVCLGPLDDLHTTPLTLARLRDLAKGWWRLGINISLFTGNYKSHGGDKTVRLKHAWTIYDKIAFVVIEGEPEEDEQEPEEDPRERSLMYVRASYDKYTYPEIIVERRVDTVLIKQGDNVIQLDSLRVEGLRKALNSLAPDHGLSL